MIQPDAEAQASHAQHPGGADGPVAAATGTARRPAGKSLRREILETLVLTAGLFLVARGTVQPFRVDGHSMDPTLHDTEFILVDTVSYRLGTPQRGDIIVRWVAAHSS